MLSSSFASLCNDLAHLQIRMLQRNGDPLHLASEALSAIQSNLHHVHASKQNVPHIPMFLRSCATLLQMAPPCSMDTYQALDAASSVAREYIHASCGDANESCSVLHSIMHLIQAEGKAHHQPSCQATTIPTDNYFSELLSPAYDIAFNKWWDNRSSAYTSSTLSLLKASGMVYAPNFCFSTRQPGIHGLLPVKSKVHMEAKLQRCPGARDFLQWLSTQSFNRLDAGICLQTMADSGFYDAAVCNKSCDVLFRSRALVTSQQSCDVIYNLGVLQHRNARVRDMLLKIKPEECTAEGVRRQVMGLAMLQHPPPTRLMDGVFLHALRCSGSNQKKNGQQPSIRRANKDNPYRLSPQWYIDVAYALACLQVTNHKFCLRTVQYVRQGVGKQSVSDRCKILYGIGGVPNSSVPPELRERWHGKVDRTIAIVADTLEDMDSPSDGPRIMNALLHCGITEHPRIPRNFVPCREDPVDLLVRTWSTAVSKERILELSEQIEPEMFTRLPSTTLADVLLKLASMGGAASACAPHEMYRFGALCSAVETYGERMSVNDALRSLYSLRQMGLVSAYRGSVVCLLAHLWSMRSTMTDFQRQRCHSIVQPLEGLEDADNLKRFCLEGSF